MIYEFYGETCPHCKVMAPIVEKLSAELGVEVQKMEVWDNEENAQKMEEFSKGRCMGVPFFYNDANDEFICGSTTEDNLKEFMIKK